MDENSVIRGTGLTDAGEEMLQKEGLAGRS